MITKIVVLLLVLPLTVSAMTKKVVFSTGEYPPFISESLPGKGPAVRVVSEACKRASLKCEFQFFPWSRVMLNAKLGYVDASFLWYKTVERLKEFHYSKYKIAQSITAVFYKKSLSPSGIKFTKWSDLKEYKILGVQSYWYQSAYKKDNFTPINVSKSLLAWRMLSKGRGEVYADSFQTGMYEGKHFLKDKFEEIGFTINHNDVRPGHIIYPKKSKLSPEIMRRLDLALKSIHDDGTYKELTESLVHPH